MSRTPVTQAVILAAGRGTRMGALTESTPKVMLEVAGRTLLEYKFDALPDEVNEIILVVSYLGGVIHDRFGGEYFGKRILYVEQESSVGGTADALWKAKDLLKDRFFVMNGDNMYVREDIIACTTYEWAIVVQKTDAVHTGSVAVDANMRVKAIKENTEHTGEAGWANTGLYLLDTRIFNYAPVPKTAASAELGLPQTMMLAAHDIVIQAIPAHWWIEIKEPADLKKAEQALGGAPA